MDMNRNLSQYRIIFPLKKKPNSKNALPLHLAQYPEIYIATWYGNNWYLIIHLLFKWWNTIYMYINIIVDGFWLYHTHQYFENKYVIFFNRFSWEMMIGRNFWNSLWLRRSTEFTILDWSRQNKGLFYYHGLSVIPGGISYLMPG